MIGVRKDGRKPIHTPRRCHAVLAFIICPNILVICRPNSSGMLDIDSVPAARIRLASPAAMRLAPVVIDSMPLAQLRCTVLAMRSSGSPALSAMTRATLAESAGWATLPTMTSSRSLPLIPVRAISSRTATVPRSSAEYAASVPPALLNGVRSPSMIAMRSFMVASRPSGRSPRGRFASDLAL